MKQLTSLLATLLLLLASTAWSQQLGKRITNKDVIDMAGLGLSDDVIISKSAAPLREEPSSSTPASTA